MNMLNTNEFKKLNFYQINDIMEIIEVHENIWQYIFSKFHDLEKFVAELEVAEKGRIFG